MRPLGGSVSGVRAGWVMARVYVSSTIADLTRERRAVLEWLRAARHQAMDSYLPASDTVRDSCLEDVDTSDLYVLILGHRYGFQPSADNPEGLSITHLEFRRAGQSGIPRIALLRTSIPDVGLSDMEDLRKWPLVLAFRAEVAREVRPAEFGDLSGLIQGLSTGVEAELARRDQRSPGDQPLAARRRARDAARPVRLRWPSIFLCYRREDTQGFARGIYQSLASEYGHEQVFRDIDSTPAGVRFSTWIESKVGQCSVMIVLIGDAWSSAMDQTGQRRLDSPKDWVRQEIESAMRQNIPIIPVRVQGARMPSEDELPPSIADLAGFQSAEITDSRWDFDVGMLIQAVDYLTASD